ncbi:DNA polymerase I [Spiroplasma tabanidicola]|uniref:DNA polymerase I n=1 Tax=Spiroplasma tabanidicola TaxID=324079 RepID=A0A6I6C5T8_9MOLU|nr:DNA polymerase I [Spiroplasma tabanidicola]QGS52257.1 DNA polymerase I [Spiroplasma tabanidicola]
MKKRILLVDGNALIFRAFYSSYGRANLTTRSGIPTNAVYSFINMLLNIVQKNEYYDIKVAFDKGKKTFRHDKLESYKAGRKQTPPELVQQFPIVREFLSEAHIDWYELDGYEADDIIGSISNMVKETDDYVVDILTSDQDMYQLITKNIFVIAPQTGTSDLITYDRDKLFEKWGITPEQVIDYKGLRGDSSDNIKGVSGIGEKTAKDLLQEFKNLEDLYNNIDKITGPKKQKLIDGKEDAFLSKEIATIYTNIKLEDFSFRETKINFNNLKDFFIKYEMVSLVRKYSSEVEDVEPKQTINFKKVSTWNSSYSDKHNYIYLEVLNDNYHNPDVIGMGIVNAKGNFYYAFENQQEVSIFNWQEKNIDENLQKFLLENEFYSYDIKKTMYVLKTLGYQIKHKNFVYDMMIACYVINSNVKSNFESHLNLIDSSLEIETFDEVFGKGVKKTKDIDENVKIKYILKKALLIEKTKEEIINSLKETNQYELYQKVELPFCYVLLDMEYAGVLIDRKELENQTQNILKLLTNLEKEANEILKRESIEPINYASPKQLKELLFVDLGLKNYNKGSTDKETLDALLGAHAIIEKVIEIRKYSKLYSTYLKGFEKFINNKNKVHTIFNQTLTNTGRLSSTDPNLQNISIRDEEQRKVRKIFIAQENYIFLSFDYSQIELRVLADVAKEETLIQAYKNNEDIHELAARNIFGLDANEIVSSDQRRVAKVFNFGILYGLTKFGLSKDLKISQAEADQYIKAYNKTFPMVQEYKDKIIKECEENGFVETMANRRRYIYELQNSNFMVREFGKRAAINAPIQGTAADILKVAMINIFEMLESKQLDAKLVAQIHDEVILHVKNDNIDKVKVEVQQIMNQAYDDLLKIANKNRTSDVKLEVNSGVGATWYDLK